MTARIHVMLEPKKLPQVVDQKKAAQGVAAIMLWGFICFSGYFFCSFSKEQDAKKLAAQPPKTATPNPFPDPQDDAETMMAKYGLPEEDDSTDADKPRPPLVTRWLTYKSVGVKAMFLCGGKVGDPPPCGRRWMLLGFTDPATKAPREFDDALARLKPLLREDAPSKRFKTAAAQSAITEKDAQIAKLKKAGIVRSLEFRQYAAELQVYPAAFMSLPMQSKREICNLVFQRAMLTADNTMLVVHITDYRTEKEFGACSDGLPFEMAD